jgi:hypothetical protein
MLTKRAHQKSPKDLIDNQKRPSFDTRTHPAPEEEGGEEVERGTEGRRDGGRERQRERETETHAHTHTHGNQKGSTTDTGAHQAPEEEEWATVPVKSKKKSSKA